MPKSTSTVAPPPWATLSAHPAPACWPPWWAACARPAARRAWHRCASAAEKPSPWRSKCCSCTGDEALARTIVKYSQATGLRSAADPLHFQLKQKLPGLTKRRTVISDFTGQLSIVDSVKGNPIAYVRYSRLSLRKLLHAAILSR